MSTAPAVSVLIPCRNAERFLAATLDSVRRQTLAPVEVILVDDGCTDRSADIAAAHHGFVTVVRNPGHGASAARNHATQLSHGDFLQYLDADDLLEPHALASRVSELDQAGAEVVISDWQRLIGQDGGWQPAKVESGRISDDSVPLDLQVFRGFWAPPAAILYRRSVVLRIGGWRESLPVIQDARFLLDAARVGGRFVHVSGVGALYRQHTGTSLSTGGTARFWSDVLQNTREVEELWKDAGRFDAVHRSAIADAYAHTTRVGFVHERTLFFAARAELNRFPEQVPSPFLRVALLLARLAGYAPARRLLSPFCR
jgi:glycosyltransferase involved in cell wall biosynthesis